MGRKEMRERTVVNRELYREKVKPFFNAMGWEMKTAALPPGAIIIVHSVTRSKIGGEREPVPESIVRDVIGGCLNETGADTEQEAVELTPLEKLTPINAHVYSEYLVPYFDRLRWTVERQHNEFGGVVITGARDEHGNSVSEDALVFAARKAMPGIAPPGMPANEKPDQSSPPDSGAALEQEVAESTPLDKLTPINAAGFLKRVKPYFDGLEWSLEYYVNEWDGVVVVGARDELDLLVDEDRLLHAVREALPGAAPPGLADVARDLDGAAKAFMDIPDYTKIREDPGNDGLMKEYADQRLTIHRDDLTETVKPAFVDRAWIYSGEHYGDGSVQIQAVVNKKQRVVSLETVCRILDDLDVRYDLKPRDADLETEERRKDSTEGTLPRLEFTPDEDLEIGERSPGEFDQDELDRQEAAEAAMKQEETEARKIAEQNVGGVLVSTDEDVMGLKAVYSPQTKRVTVELHLASNVIAVECSQAQFTNFFNCVEIAAAMLAEYETGNVEETTKDERCESEDNSGQ